MSEQTPSASSKIWSNRWTFILAASGSAIGLGNIWKFPYITGDHGGGGVVLVYLICIVVIGIPLLMAETIIGRYTRLSPLSGIKKLTSEQGVSSFWKIISWLGMLTGLLILSFYSVTVGWSLSYAWDVLSNIFGDMTVAQIDNVFSELTLSAPRQIMWHTVFMLVTLFITARGIHKGLEKGFQVMMPVLFVLLFIMLGYSILKTDAFMQGVRFMFAVDFSTLTGATIIAALGQALFTMGLSMCVLMAYGAYMPSHDSIAKTAFQVAILNTVMALIAGLIVFSIIFSYGLQPTIGPGLLFVSFTIAFSHMPMGHLFGCLFFVLIAIAALGSAISLLEPAIAWLTERLKLSRIVAAALLCLTVWFVGLGTIFTFTGDLTVTFFDRNFFSFIDFLTSSILMPLVGLLTAIFAGWKMKRSTILNELALSHGLFNLWRGIIRVIIPACLIAVLVMTII
ncbi:MAG: sodium-dependent transporter [Candidatus Endonucleobacter sp. (ex Gigantidas childressi)]|nr:sodium-dependent transporter [Candidatus Endonucleobacter sp. (ex Gigantidas childressi)]